MVQVATALVELDIDHGVVRQHGHQHVDRRYVRADDDDVKHVAERVCWRLNEGAARGCLLIEATKLTVLKSVGMSR